MTASFVFEWSGSLLGLLGSALIASNSKFARYGFVAFLFSNFFWIAYGINQGAMGLILMQIGFVATSIMGIVNWFKKTDSAAAKDI